MRLKAQADIVSMIMIVVVSLGLVSTALMWGLPLIEKQQDTVIVERTDKAFDINNMNSLPKKIETVARNGGDLVFTIDTNGKWYLDRHNQTGENNNSVRFTFAGRAYKVAQSIPGELEWVALSTGNPASSGTLSIDEPMVVFGRTDKTGDRFSITYKVWFRELWDATRTNGYKIVLFAEGSNTSTGNSIKISRRSDPKPDPTNEKLIITEINILFV
jgi:hypothetical protein